MSYIDLGRAVLILLVVYPAAFFWAPSTTASLMPDTGPVNEFMRSFRYWDRHRVWVATAGIGFCLLAALLFSPPIIFPISVFLGLAALWIADVLQIHRTTRDHLKAPP